MKSLIEGRPNRDVLEAQLAAGGHAARRLRAMLDRFPRPRYVLLLTLEETEDIGYFQWRITPYDVEEGETAGYYTFEYSQFSLIIEMCRNAGVLQRFYDDWVNQQMTLIAEAKTRLFGSDNSG